MRHVLHATAVLCAAAWPGGVSPAGQPAPGDLLFTIPNPEQNQQDGFGVSIAAVGQNIIVGAYKDDVDGFDNGGSIYVFDGETGGLLRKIQNPHPDVNDYFGSSIAPFGGNVLVGAWGDHPTGVHESGCAYLFDVGTGERLLTIPNPHPGPNPPPGGGDQFGSSFTSIGDLIVVSARADNSSGVRAAGTVFLYDGRTGDLVRTIDNPDPDENDLFGDSLAVVDGSLIVGTPNERGASGRESAGVAYVFDPHSGELLRTIENADPQAYDFFGAAMATVGSNILVSAKGDDIAGDNEAGRVYLLEPETGGVLLDIANPEPDDSYHFGSSLAGVGNNFLVGTPSHNYAGVTGTGSAYLFDGSTGALLASVRHPRVEERAFFGSSVAECQAGFAVGTMRDDLAGLDTGAVYVFAVPEPSALLLATLGLLGLALIARRRGW